jgi:hypothetical protein
VRRLGLTEFHFQPFASRFSALAAMAWTLRGNLSAKNVREPITSGLMALLR